MTAISQDIKSVIDYVMEYASETSNWLDVKKEIMWNLATPKRKLFSRRHYSTKKHSLNEFELQILSYWKQKTGVTLSIPAELQHDPKWVRHDRGWGLRKYNLLRQEKRSQQEKLKRKSTKRKSNAERQSKKTSRNSH
jgi:hypothetical protein